MRFRFFRLLAFGFVGLLAAPSSFGQSVGDLIGSFPVLTEPADALAIGGGEVLVSRYFANQIDVYDTSGNYLRPFAASDRPLGMILTSEGNVAVASLWQGYINLFAPSGALLFRSPNVVSNAAGIVETASGDLLVGGLNGGIALVDGATGNPLPHPFPAVSAPGMDFDADGNLLVVSSEGAVSKYDGVTGALIDQVPGSIGSIVYDAEIGPDGNLYFANRDPVDGALYRVDPATMDAYVLINEADVSTPLGIAFVGGEIWLSVYEGDSMTRLVGPGGVEPPLVTGSLAYGACPSSGALPLGRSACRVDAAGTFNGEEGQRYTAFLRVAETGRIAFRGEIKPRAGQTVNQSVKFKTVGADPAAFTLEMLVEEGSVAAPSGEAAVLASLPFTKGATLRADEALSVFPNPATAQATLRFAVAEAGEATLVVYDALGREVARPVDGAVSGAVEASFDASGLPAGVYVARLTTGAGTETVRLSVVR